MGRGHSTVIALLSVMIFPALAMAQSVVILNEIEILDESDIGIEGVSYSPDGGIVIAHGVGSAVFIIDSASPENNTRIEAPGNISLLAASFHPGGKSALLVGEDGEVLRLILSNFSFESSGGSSTFGETQLNAVSWNGDGSWSYIGGEEGWIWRFRGIENGGIEAIPIENRGTSDINAISCLRSSNVCIVSTDFDGIGIIDENHELIWIGGFEHPWVDVECNSISDLECISISSDLTIARITVNAVDASQTEIYDNDFVQLQGFEGSMTGIEPQWGGNNLISMAPFGLIEHDSGMGKSFHWLDNVDAVDFDVGISGERIVGTWGTAPFEGWIVTDRGSIVSFDLSGGGNDGSMLEIWIGVIILGGTTLMLISLLTSSSPKMSRWITKKIGSDEERRSAIKEERRLLRKKGRA